MLPLFVCANAQNVPDIAAFSSAMAKKIKKAPSACAITMPAFEEQITKSGQDIVDDLYFANEKYRQKVIEMLISHYQARCFDANTNIGAPENPHFTDWEFFWVKFINLREVYDYYKPTLPFTKERAYKSDEPAANTKVALIINRNYAVAFSLINNKPMFHEYFGDKERVVSVNLYKKERVPLLEVDDTQYLPSL